MKRPAFQFYPGDWQRDANLRRCSHAARGAWMDVLCLLHDAEEYGILRWPLAEIASAAGAPVKLLRELADKGVLKGSDSEAIEYRFQPSHAGKLGDPVVLVPGGPGPCWYSGRFVKDEYVRQRRGAGTRFDSDNQPPKQEPNSPPMGGIGVRQGYGASSASASALKPEASRQAPEISQGTDAGLACRLMREAGCGQTNPSHPDLLAALAEGVTPQVLAHTVREAIAANVRKPFAYAITTARGRRADGARDIDTTTGKRQAEPSWQAKGVASILGVNPHDVVDNPFGVVQETAGGMPDHDFPAQPRAIACVGHGRQDDPALGAPAVGQAARRLA